MRSERTSGRCEQSSERTRERPSAYIPDPITGCTKPPRKVVKDQEKEKRKEKESLEPETLAAPKEIKMPTTPAMSNDAGTINNDAGTNDDDAGTNDDDADTNDDDADTNDDDAGTIEDDAGTSNGDAGTNDDGAAKKERRKGRSWREFDLEAHICSL